jgi:hypothetical protein
MTKSELYTWLERAKTTPPDEDGPGLRVADSWISPLHHYFCLAIPKTACSKIKLVLQQLEGLPIPAEPLRIHYRNTPGIQFLLSIADFTTLAGVEILTASDWFRFAFVRNPYARLFSAYKSVVMELDSPYIGFRAAIRQRAGYPTLPGAALGRVGFADFVRYIAEQPDDQRDGHRRSQVGVMQFHSGMTGIVGCGWMETPRPRRTTKSATGQAVSASGIGVYD